MSEQPLTVVHHTVEAASEDATPIPMFEGEAVDRTKATVRSVSSLEVGDRVFHLDESVKMVIEAKVAGVDHRVNEAGLLERIHNLKAIDSVVIDWDVDLDSLRDMFNG